MEALTRLEKDIYALLNTMQGLKLENARLQELADQLSQEKAFLEDQNNSLQAAKLEATNFRENVLQRLDHLLQKIDEHDSIG